MENAETPYRAFSRSAAAHPARAFVMAPPAAGLSWAPKGYSMTYAEAEHKITGLRCKFLDAGYGRGSRIGLLLENRPTFLLHWLALNSIGASIVPLNGEMRPEELQHQIRTSRAETVIALESYTSLLGQSVPDEIPVFGEDTALSRAVSLRAPGLGLPEDEAALLFTSGSSGKPKACILSNLYFSMVADWYATLPGVAKIECPVAVTPLPFYHMNALACTAGGMITVGGTIVTLDRFHPSSWWRIIAECRATLVHALGVIPAILLQLPEGPDDLSHVANAIFSPGVDAIHKIAFESRFGLPVLEGWSMTETGGAAVTDTVGLVGTLGPRCIGRPRVAVDWRIVDDHGREVAVGEVGELVVRAQGTDLRRGFFSGYLGDPVATEEAWKGGWFHTGDIIRADADGLFYFIDRNKSIVRRSGENISALEVEAALVADPAVRSAAVTAVADAMRGEEVFAFVVPAGLADTDGFATDLLSRLAKRLTYHKLPGFLALVDSLPFGGTQKLLRGQIKADAEAALMEGKAIDLRREKAAQRTKAGSRAP